MSANPRLRNWLVVGAIGLIAIALGIVGVRRLRDAALRVTFQNHPKQIALGCHNYESALGHFPPLALPEVSNRAGLSWRFEIMSYVEASSVYKEFRRTEPWDSPYNLAAAHENP